MTIRKSYFSNNELKSASQSELKPESQQKSKLVGKLIPIISNENMTELKTPHNELNENY